MIRARSLTGFWDGLTEPPIIPAAFAAGVAIALAHLAISLEIGVSLTYHESFTRSIFLALYPLGVAFMGLGAVLERRLCSRVPMPALTGSSLRAAGASLLVFLALALRVNFFVRSREELAVAGVLHLAALAAWFLSLGVAVASLLRAARQREDPRWVGCAWTAHLAGLLAGYAAIDSLVHAVGANAILLAVGASLLAASRGAPLLLALLLAAAPAVSLDARIEGLRDLSLLKRGEIRTMASSPDQASAGMVISLHQEMREVLFRGWSRFGYVQIGRMAHRGVRGFYNFVPQWEVPPADDPDIPLDMRWRALAYSVLRPSQRVLLLAAGGGRGVSCLPFPPHKGVTAVELNERVVRFLRDESPELNAGNFRKATAFAADARFAVDTSAEPFDAILVESGRFQNAQITAPAGSPQTLYTRESISRYLSRLRPGGLLLILFDGVFPTPFLEYFPMQAIQTLSESGVPFRVFAAAGKGSMFLAVAASSSPAVLKEVGRRTASLGSLPLHRVEWRPQTAKSPGHRIRLTDDQPFAPWNCMAASRKRSLSGAALLLAGISALLALGLGRPRLRPRPALDDPPILFFFLIGAAQVMMLIGGAYAYRSFFGDPVTTTIRFTVYSFAYGALGSLASRRLLEARRGRLFAAAAVLMGLHAAGLARIPFETGSAVMREILAALMLAPGGLFMGALFPAGISAASQEDLDRRLLADSLGAVAGCALVYLILLPGGIRAFLAAAFGLYAAALAVFPRLPRED
ncbi:MAG: hypothetical protein HY926_09200 [Elusimicrobia bacterium]|nr:hypothetical protein [Elusimicrobiota bacterium]